MKATYVKGSVLAVIPFVIFMVIETIRRCRALISAEALKGLLGSIFPQKTVDIKLAPPHHLAVIYGDSEQWSFDSVVDFIENASREGISRLSLYDVNGSLKTHSEEVNELWKQRRVQSKSFMRPAHVCLPSESGPHCSNGLCVQFLGPEDGDRTMIQIAKQASQTEEPLTVENVNENLEQLGVYEVDFLLSIGCANSLGRFPAWALRVAEIQPVPVLDRYSPSCFKSFLYSFSKRERRLGR